jgi:hypothetical protein
MPASTRRPTSAITADVNGDKMVPTPPRKRRKASGGFGWMRRRRGRGEVVRRLLVDAAQPQKGAVSEG